MREDHPAAPGEKKASSKGKAFSSIQGRLVSLLLLVLVPILLVQAYFSYNQYQSTKRIESEANLHLARATARAFDTFVQDVLHQELAIGLAFTLSQPLSEKEKNRILFDNQAGNPAIWHLFWTNPAGIVTAATGVQFIGMDISDREFYREIVAGKEWVVSDLLLSKTTKQPSFTISRGFRNQRGELIGMIVAGILPAKLDRVLAVERPGDAGVSLLDSKGMNVYRYPATQFTWEQRNWLKLYPIIGEVLKGKEVVTNLVSNRTGTNRIVAFTPIPYIGWIVACGRAEGEVVRPIISATLQETGITLLVAFISLLTAAALSRTISSPVIILRNYARSLGQGETQNHLTISRPAEIKDLAEAFNKMAEEIRSREMALQESEERFSLFMNNSPTIAWIKDDLGRYIYLSTSYEKRFGVKLADWQGKTDAELWSAEIAAEFRKNDLAVMATGKSVQVVEETVAPDGGRCYWLNSKFTYLNSAGDRFVAGIGLDITERKQTERELQRAETEARERVNELEAIMEAMPAITFIAHDKECRLMTSSRAAHELLRLPPDTNTSLSAPVKQRPRTFRPIKDGRELRPEELPVQRSAATGEVFRDYELTLAFDDGSQATIYGNSVPLLDECGQPRGAIASFLDITDHKRADEEASKLNEIIVQEKDRLSALLNSITDEIWFADTAGQFTLVNPSASREFMLRTDGAFDVCKLAEGLEVLRPDGSLRPIEEAPPLRALRGEVVQNQEEILRTPATNVLRFRQVSSAPVCDAKGHIIGAVSVVRDITDRKQAEEQIKASLAEKEVLLKEIHHRVKNNLQVISSLVGLQSDSSKDEAVRQVLRDVTYRVRSMALVHEKLYQSADLAHIDFAEYTRSLLSYLWRAHGADATAVRMTLDLEPVSLPADTAVSCGLILNELVVNALKHAFQGQPDGKVKVSLRCGADRRISLCVADNGIGLPMGLDWRKASSLGLRLVQMLARQLDATAEVSSGDGTKFEIIFEYPDSTSLLS